MNFYLKSYFFPFCVMNIDNSYYFIESSIFPILMQLPMFISGKILFFDENGLQNGKTQKDKQTAKEKIVNILKNILR